MTDSDDDLEKALEEVSFQAWNNAEGEEALKILAFSAGVDVETAVRNVGKKAPEAVVRATLTGLLLGYIDAGRGDMVMEILKDMATLGFILENGGDLSE